MKKQKPAGVVEEKGETAPLWIISFADMISLLMAFFVMLLTMTTSRSGKLCNEGEGIFEKTLYGFRSTITGLGIPEIFGGRQDMYGRADDKLNFDHRKVYHSISDGKDATNRTIDAVEERLRRTFAQLGKNAQTLKSPITGQQPKFVVPTIAFGAGQFVLDDSARQFLSKFAANLRISESSRYAGLYVVGFAPEESDATQQWIVSARRAQAVAEFLKEKLYASGILPIYSWGAGSGGEWTGAKSPIAKQTQVVIAVLSNKF